jgi:putative tricarboxylic transport membrane protein
MKNIITLVLVAVVCATGILVPAANAAWKPEKNVELVIGSEAGGENDRIVRALILGMTRNKLIDGNININVVSKPGGNQGIASAYVESRKGDPYSLVMVADGWVAGQVTKGNPNFLKGFQPLVRLLVAYCVFTVKTDSPIKNMADVKERLVSKGPDSVSFGFSTSVGNANHIGIANVGIAAGVAPAKMKAIVFKTGPASSAAVAGGHVEISVSSMGSALPLVEAGKLRFIGVGSPNRLGGVMKDVPTLKEQGMDVDTAIGYTILAPAGITEDQKVYWESVLSKALDTKEFLAVAEENSWIVDKIPSSGLKAHFDGVYNSLRKSLVSLELLK